MVVDAVVVVTIITAILECTEDVKQRVEERVEVMEVQGEEYRMVGKGGMDDSQEEERATMVLLSFD
jgi:hypothetical protein